MTDYLDEVVGQETAKRILRTAIKKDRLYNLLFCGPKGVGKRLMGFALAKTLGSPPNSPNFILIGPIPSRIKDKTDKIFEYAKRYLPENPIIEIEDRTSILIEQIRVTIEKLVSMPTKGTKRVVLILEADRMTEEAANSFLKTLEEPPMDTVFILTSSRPNFLLPTIRSRCQIVPFSHLTGEQIKEVIFEGRDEFKLGSPGEILNLRENSLFEKVLQIFKSSPLTPAKCAELSKELERQRLVDVFYPLLLFYRLVFYKQQGIKIETPYYQLIEEKAKKIPVSKVMDTILLLNYSLNLLEQNPNHLLLLLNTLLKLP
uniref:AAA family ATPase n=1 Tax=candidate division WOR-3 bacterium TaxID=2052148 RepID=A0A7C4XAV3_UNCW3